MGRPDRLQGVDDDQRFHLQKLKRVDYDYDEGGAYWGFGPGSDPVWRLVPEDLSGEGFVRAKGRADARRQVREKFPRARFFGDPG